MRGVGMRMGTKRQHSFSFQGSGLESVSPPEPELELSSQNLFWDLFLSFTFNDRFNSGNQPRIITKRLKNRLGMAMKNQVAPKQPPCLSDQDMFETFWNTEVNTHEKTKNFSSTCGDGS